MSPWRGTGVSDSRGRMIDGSQTASRVCGPLAVHKTVSIVSLRLDPTKTAAGPAFSPSPSLSRERLESDLSADSRERERELELELEAFAHFERVSAGRRALEGHLQAQIADGTSAFAASRAPFGRRQQGTEISDCSSAADSLATMRSVSSF